VLCKGFMDFGSYVRNARESRHLTFDDVSIQTKIKRTFWSDLEANDLKRWPREEIYRRGFLRSYAAAVGLDPDDVLARFAEQFAERPAVVSCDAEHDQPRPVERKLQKPALPRLRQFSANAVLPLLLIGMGAFAFEDRKAPAVLGKKPAASIASVAHVQQPRPEATKVDVVRTDGSPAAERPGAAETPVVVDPQPIPPAEEMEGTLFVESNPPDAFITVNGIGRGKTPVKVEYLAFGSYTIRVVQSGYQIIQKRVTLDSTNPRRMVKLDLRPVS